MQNEFTLGQQANANNRYGMQNDYNLGLGRNSNELLGIQNQYNLGRQANNTNQYSAETDRTNVGNQYSLGQGQLGFQNRELDVNDVFRNKQLGQEADLTREKFGNDLMQSRYQSFGRAVQPGQGAKMLRSWG